MSTEEKEVKPSKEHSPIEKFVNVLLNKASSEKYCRGHVEVDGHFFYISAELVSYKGSPVRVTVHKTEPKEELTEIELTLDAESEVVSESTSN